MEKDPIRSDPKILVTLDVLSKSEVDNKDEEAKSSRGELTSHDLSELEN